jgi:hypothetical protein
MTSQNPPHGDPRKVAYLNEQFLNSPDARALRILSEFLEPLAHFRREKIRDTVVFFGSARIREEGPMSQYYHDARTLSTRTSIASSSVPAAARGSWKRPTAGLTMPAARQLGST